MIADRVVRLPISKGTYSESKKGDLYRIVEGDLLSVDLDDTEKGNALVVDGDLKGNKWVNCRIFARRKSDKSLRDKIWRMQ